MKKLFINPIITYFLIIIFSSIISLYLFESYQNLSKIIKEKRSIIYKSDLYKKDTGKDFDKRTKLEMYYELQDNYKKISIVITPFSLFNKNLSIYPLSGISDSYTLNDNENGYHSYFISDKYGFNNPEGSWDNELIEYLLIGDSFTLGTAVNRPNDFGSLLRQNTDNSVLNLGYAGNGPLMELATLKEYIMPNVKNILWFFYEGNDFINLNEELKSEILLKYLRNEDYKQNLKYKQNLIDDFVNKNLLDQIKIEKIANKFSTKIREFIFLRKTRNLIFNTNFLSKQTIPKEFKLIFTEVKKIAKKNNSNLFFIYLPQYERYKFKNFQSKKNQIFKIINQLNIPFIDIDNLVFKTTENPLNLFPFKEKGHYNELGYKKISYEIKNFIAEYNISN